METQLNELLQFFIDNIIKIFNFMIVNELLKYVIGAIIVAKIYNSLKQYIKKG